MELNDQVWSQALQAVGEPREKGGRHPSSKAVTLDALLLCVQVARSYRVQWKVSGNGMDKSQKSLNTWWTRLRYVQRVQ